MSDKEDNKPFAAEVAKQGRAVCKKCKQKCLQGVLRLAKLVPSPFGSGKMKSWHHIDCMFEVFQKQRKTTKRIESSDDIEGFNLLDEEHQSLLLKKIDECDKLFYNKFHAKVSPTKKTTKETIPSPTAKTFATETNHKDFLFKGFRKLIADVSNVDSYTEKTSIIQKMFQQGSDGLGFKGDLIVWCRLLLPGVEKAVYNLQSEQLVKLFSRIYSVDYKSMLKHLNQDENSDVIQEYLTKKKLFKPARNSLITLQEVDDFLKDLTRLTKEEEQLNHFKGFLPRCTANDLKIIIRLIQHDLRMNAGAKHVLNSVHPDAYQIFQSSSDITYVINRCLNESHVNTSIHLMTPVLPMLASACKSVEQTIEDCPNGMYSEMKYDGERVQVHKQGENFKYFSRRLKPVISHKVEHFKDFISKAFPHAEDLILDCVILMIDTVTGNPLPIGTLGEYEESEIKDACACLFVFDCLYYNGESLMHKPLKNRKEILQKNMVEIQNRVILSQMDEINKPEDLRSMIAKVLKAGLEGLVLKDVMGEYEPGKRHWLKLKRDYLFNGAMADTADLIVLGAWKDTGKKRDIKSIFLMGAYNKTTKKFCTVTKLHLNHDDKTLEKLQSDLEMIKISGDSSEVPTWLNCNKPLIPEYVANDPKIQPVWEITGAEFTKDEVQTADSISIRLSRLIRVRNDKHWETATTVQELKQLYKKSKETPTMSLLTSLVDVTSPSKQKKKTIIECIEEESKPTKRKSSQKSTKSKEATDVNSLTNSADTTKPSRTTKSKKKTISEYTEEDLKSTKRKCPIISSQKPKKSKEPTDVSPLTNPMDTTKPASPLKLKRKTIIDCIEEDSKSTKRRSSTFNPQKPRKKPKVDGSVEPSYIEDVPGYFRGVKTLLGPEIKEKYPDLIDYFVAHGGIVLNNDDFTEATHVIHLYGIISKPTINCPKTARHVVIEWIQHTVAKKALPSDIRQYIVRWDPNA